MASIVKRGASWQYIISRYVDGKYKPIRKAGFKTKHEAKVAADEIEYKLNTGQRIKNEHIAFSKYFEDWYSIYKTNVSKQTLNHYKDSLRYIKEHFGEVTTIQEIKRKDYQVFLNEYGKKYAKETISKVHGHIKAAVDHAVEDEIIRINFADKVILTGKQSKDKSEKYLEFEDSEKLYKTLMKNLNRGLSYYGVLLLLVSGMRFEELVGLTRNDFDFESNTITINKVWGYSNKMPEGFGKTKNKQSVRTIKIDADVMREFKKLFMKMPDNINRLVFFSVKSKYRVISNTIINKTLKKALNLAGIKKQITAHELRHTHASALIYKKTSIIYVSERLGHAGTEITYKRYAHLMKELREEDEKIAINIY